MAAETPGAPFTRFGPALDARAGAPSPRALVGDNSLMPAHPHWWSNTVELDSVLEAKAASGDIVLVAQWRHGDPLGLDGVGLKAMLRVVKRSRWADRARWADSRTRAVDWPWFKQRLHDTNLAVYKHKQAGLDDWKDSYHVGWAPNAKAAYSLRPHRLEE
jgi:hypothetical protein